MVFCCCSLAGRLLSPMREASTVSGTNGPSRPLHARMEGFRLNLVVFINKIWQRDSLSGTEKQPKEKVSGRISRRLQVDIRLDPKVRTSMTQGGFRKTLCEKTSGLSFRSLLSWTCHGRSAYHKVLVPQMFGWAFVQLPHNSERIEHAPNCGYCFASPSPPSRQGEFATFWYQKPPCFSGKSY